MNDLYIRAFICHRSGLRIAQQRRRGPTVVGGDECLQPPPPVGKDVYRYGGMSLVQISYPGEGCDFFHCQIFQLITTFNGSSRTVKNIRKVRYITLKHILVVIFIISRYFEVGYQSDNYENIKLILLAAQICYTTGK